MKEKDQKKSGKPIPVTMEPPLKLCNVCGEIRTVSGEKKRNTNGEKETN